ncbi:hypothetical protein ACTUVK_004161 [Stenotrophomonas rhizophila]
MKADWTHSGPLVGELLKAHTAPGIPLYVRYRPHQQGEVLPQVLTLDVMRRALAPVDGAVPAPAPDTGVQAPRGRPWLNFSRAWRWHSATVLSAVPFSGSSAVFNDDLSQICKLLGQEAVVESSDRGPGACRAADPAATRRISRLQ